MHARLLFCILNIACWLLLPTHAQEDAELPPPPKRPGVRITFVPPPLKGTISLGVFNKEGTLVRTLHREAATKEFVVGLNGLITWWDGKTDAGGVAPAGKYFVRGYAVGQMEIEGVAYHCNDWMTDGDAPHVLRIFPAGHFNGFAGVELSAELSNGKIAKLNLMPNAENGARTRVVSEESPVAKSAEEIAKGAAEESAANAEMGLPADLSWFLVGDDGFAFGDGKLWHRVADRRWEPVDWKGLGKVVSACLGTNSVWVIDEGEQGAEVKQYSLTGEVLRHLAIGQGEPVPRRIDEKGDELFLFEEGKDSQRVRILWKESPAAPDADGTSVSRWKVVASKTIHASDTFAMVAEKLGREKPPVPDEKISVRLLPNQLVRNAVTSAEIAVGVDAKGSFLRTADGLPLKRITEAPSLKWVVMMREPEGKAVTIFQSDGAVVEEFKARKLASMMAFDAGDYEWAGK